MTFKEWWSVEGIQYDLPTSTARAAYEAGVQEGINRMYLLYDICPECRETAGRHQMGCQFEWRFKDGNNTREIT